MDTLNFQKNITFVFTISNHKCNMHLSKRNTCKANAPREKVMVAGGWFIKETAEQTKKDLKEFKAFVKEKFSQQASDLVVYFGHSRQKAEAAALETARSRIKCWKEAQA